MIGAEQPGSMVTRGSTRGRSLARHTSLRLLVAWLIVVAPLLAVAEQSLAAQQTNPTKVTSVQGVTEYRLANGLQVLLYPDPTDSRTTLNVMYRVGSRDDPPAGSGMAHMLEHLMFRRTVSRTDIQRQLVDRNLQYNGATWMERTSYFETFPASQQALEWAIELEADRMGSLVVDESEFLAERRIVLNEIDANGQSPFGVTLQMARDAAYAGHPYAKPVLGSRKEIESLSIPQVMAFYRAHYRPDNATIIIGGNFDGPRTLRALSAAFAGDQRFGSGRRREATVTAIAATQPVLVVVSSEDLKTVGVLARTGPGSSTRYVAGTMLQSMLSEGDASPLRRRLVLRGSASDVKGFADGFRDDGYLFFFVQGRSDADLAHLREQVIAAIRDSLVEVLTPQSVQAQQMQQRSRFEEALRSASTIDMGLLDVISTKDWRTFFAVQNIVEHMSSERLRSLAAEIFSANVQLRDAGLQEKPVPRARTAGEPAATSAASSNGPARTAQPLDASAVTQQTRVFRARPGGPGVAVIPRRNDQGTVAIALRTVCKGVSAEQRRHLSPVMSRLVQSALSTPEPGSLRETVSAAGGKMRFAADDQGVLIAVQVPRIAAEPVVAAMVKLAPFGVLQGDKVAQIQAAAVSDLSQGKPDPQVMAVSASQSIDDLPAELDAADLLHSALDDVSRVDRAALAKLWGACFSEKNVGLAIAGEVDLASLETVLPTLLAAWPSASAETTATAVIDRPAVARKNVRVEVPGSSYGFFIARTALSTGESDPDYPATVVANYLIGGSPNSRLFTELRTRLGLSYSVASFLAPTLADGGSIFGIYASFDPNQLDQFRREIARIMDQLKEKGFEADEVKVAVDNIKKERGTSIDSDLLLSVALATNLATGKTMASIADINARLESVDVAAVNRIGKALLDSAKLDLIFAGNFSPASR